MKPLPLKTLAALSIAGTALKNVRRPIIQRMGKNKRARMKRVEQNTLHIPAVTLLKKVFPSDVMIFHIGNGGGRTATEGAIFKAMGVTAGMPDLGIIWHGQIYFIELKAPGGTLSESQLKTIPRLEKCGARVAVCETFEAIFEALDRWGIPHLPVRFYGGLNAQIMRSAP